MSVYVSVYKCAYMLMYTYTGIVHPISAADLFSPVCHVFHALECACVCVCVCVCVHIFSYIHIVFFTSSSSSAV